MKQKSLQIFFSEYDSIAELNPEDKKLLEIAVEAAKKAYAPYSGFHVGAAVQLENGTIVEGNNQENAAYPSGLCAERVALFSASARFPDTAIKAIAVTAFSNDFKVSYPVTPCGSCRQVMSEYEIKTKTPVRIILSGVDGKVIIFEGVQHLLPFGFNVSHLKPDAG